MTLNASLLSTTILSNPGLVVYDYAVQTGTTVRRVSKWLRHDPDARQLVEQGMVAVEEGKSLPDWACNENREKLPAVPVAVRTEETPDRDINALVVQTEPFDDDRLDRLMSEYRQREVGNLGPKPRAKALTEANMAVMRFNEVLHTAHKDQLRREAAADAVAAKDEVLAEKDKRIETMELLLEQYQINTSAARTSLTQGSRVHRNN